MTIYLAKGRNLVDCAREYSLKVVVSRRGVFDEFAGRHKTG